MFHTWVYTIESCYVGPAIAGRYPWMRSWRRGLWPPVAMRYDSYGRNIYTTRPARRVQRGRRQRGRRTPGILARGTTGGRDERR
jgi:hypothetical protein